MTVLVTGATGFLGRHVIQTLVDRGEPVRALVRPSSRREGLEDPAIDVAVAQLQPSEALSKALHDVDAVIHCAGGGRAPTIQRLYDDNLATTVALLQAVAEARPALRRFVFVSSIAAQGPSPQAEPLPSPAPRAPVTHYGRAKAAAEEAVLAHRDAFPVTILRPPAIYGPGDTRLLSLFRASARGWVPLPGPSVTAGFVHVEDCAEAIWQALTVPHPSGRCYCVTNEPAPALRTVVQWVGESVHTKPRIVRIPRPVLWSAALVSELWARLRGGPAMLSRDKVREISQVHWSGDATPLRSELGWRPRYTLREGLLQTASWYQAEGLLSRAARLPPT